MSSAGELTADSEEWEEHSIEGPCFSTEVVSLFEVPTGWDRLESSGPYSGTWSRRNRVTGTYSPALTGRIEEGGTVKRQRVGAGEQGHHVVHRTF